MTGPFWPFWHYMGVTWNGAISQLCANMTPLEVIGAAEIWENPVLSHYHQWCQLQSHRNSPMASYSLNHAYKQNNQIYPL